MYPSNTAQVGTPEWRAYNTLPNTGVTISAPSDAVGGNTKSNASNNWGNSPTSTPISSPTPTPTSSPSPVTDRQREFSIALANGTLKTQDQVDSWKTQFDPATGARTSGTPSAVFQQNYGIPALITYSRAGTSLAGAGGSAPGGPQNSLSGSSSSVSGASGSGGYDDSAQSRYLQNEFVQPETEAQILARKQQEAQAQANAISDTYNAQLLDQARANEQRSAETNAQSVLSGLTGSTEAGQRAFQTTALNNQDNAKIQAQKGLALATLYSQIRSEAQAEARQQKLDAHTSATDFLTRQEARRTKALADVTNLFKSGVTFDGLKNGDPNVYAKMVQAAGSEAQLKAMSILNAPAEEVLDKKFENGVYSIVRKNPVTGAITIQSFNSGLPADAKTQVIGDNLYTSTDNGKTWSLAIAGTPDALKQLQIANAQADLDKKKQALKAGEKLGQPSAYTAERTQRTINSVDAIKKQIEDADEGLVGSVGWGSIWSWLPESDSRNLASNITTLKANIAFNELNQMREASKTGGALGQVSNIEEQMLSNALGAISDQGQSKKQFLENLQAIKDSINRWNDAVQKNGGLPQSQPSDTSSTDTTDYGSKYPYGTDGAQFGYPGYHSDGTQWVSND